MNTTQYIANTASDAAVDVLGKYGLQPTDNSETSISRALDIMIAENGEPALKDMLNIHPDKDDILHYFQATAQPPAMQGNNNHNDYLRDSRNSGMNNMFEGVSNKTVVVVGAILMAALILRNN